MNVQRSVDFFMTVESIWTFFGHGSFLKMCGQRNLKPRYRPVPLQALFARTGGVAYRLRSVARQRYRDYELQRWSARRKVAVDLDSRFLPPNASLADRTILACSRNRIDPAPFAQLVLDAAWTQRQDIGDVDLLEALAWQAGLPATELLKLAETEAIKNAYLGAVDEAVHENVFGVPSFVLDGEVFWGQDRIEMLEDALVSGRAAYRPFK